ncbi:hypothetical protein PM082_020650 [Marasmius tenuissimus]|nr:hypothetical protein PM082_020650 [Marasmius tenuissimus]
MGSDYGLPDGRLDIWYRNSEISGGLWERRNPLVAVYSIRMGRDSLRSSGLMDQAPWICSTCSGTPPLPGETGTLIPLILIAGKKEDSDESVGTFDK